MHSPSVAITCDGFITPGYSTQPSSSTFNVKVSKIIIPKMSQRDVDSENTSEIAQIGISVQPNPTLLSPMTENTPP